MRIRCAFIQIDSRVVGNRSSEEDDTINLQHQLLTNYSVLSRRRRDEPGFEYKSSEMVSFDSELSFPCFSFVSIHLSDDDSFFSKTCDESRCRKIYCTVRDMHENSGVTFEVFARPWNSTLRDIGFSEFSVTSIMVARIKRLQYNVDPSFMEPRIIKVTTMINLIGLESIAIIPLWIIVLAICFGLLILFLIVVLSLIHI